MHTDRRELVGVFLFKISVNMDFSALKVFVLNLSDRKVFRLRLHSWHTIWYFFSIARHLTRGIKLASLHF